MGVEAGKHVLEDSLEKLPQDEASYRHWTR